MATAANKAGWGAGLALLILAAILAAAGGGRPPAPTTTTTSTPVIVTPAPSGGDDTAALQAALDEHGGLLIDADYRVDGTLRPPAGSTLTFTARGRFLRTVAPQSTPTLPVIELTAGNVTLTRPRIVGPNPCTWTYFGDPQLTYAQYDPKREWQHGISILGGSNYRIESPTVENVWGDALNIDRGPTDITVTNLTARCVGRSFVSNTGSERVTITGGTVTGAFWWAFNIEPFGPRRVADYRVSGVTIGFSRDARVFAGGPDFNCAVERVSFASMTVLAPDRGARIAACVASNVTGA